jgi:polar amino acid transport system substrate-binding protein
MKLRNLIALLFFSIISLSLGSLYPGRQASANASERAAARPDGSDQVSTGAALRIATSPITPFVMQEGDQLGGYDVEVWGQVARRLNLKYEWVLYDSLSQVLQAVKDGRAEAAIAAISMTAERDAYLDFTYPYFDSGLQIMLRQRPRLSFFQGISLITTPFLLEVVLLGALAGLLMGHMIWLVERRSNPKFPQKYFPGVWEGLWWVMHIVAAGSYRDLETKSVIKRLMTVTFWIVGVAIIAEFTATLTSALTIHQLNAGINGPNDLPGYHIATVNNTTAVEFLSQHQLDYTGVDQIETAYSMLNKGEVDVIVFDAPVLLYYAAHEGNNQVIVPGKTFHLEKYGIAVPTDAPLREEINRVLLQMYQDGTIESLQNKWFNSP